MGEESSMQEYYATSAVAGLGTIPGDRYTNSCSRNMIDRQILNTSPLSCRPCPERVNYAALMLIHVHRLGEFIGDHGRARRIAINYRTVDLSTQERSMADYCVKLTESPGRIEAADLQRLRDVGMDDRKIYYVVELAAAFNLTNRLTAALGYRPDDEFLQEISPPIPR